MRTFLFSSKVVNCSFICLRTTRDILWKDPPGIEKVTWTYFSSASITEPGTNLFKVMNTIHSAVVMKARYFKDCFDSGWLKVTAEEDQLRDKIPTDLKNKQADSEGQDSA